MTTSLGSSMNAGKRVAGPGTVAAAPVGGAHASHSEEATGRHLHDRAAAARARASCATKTVVAGHDLTIFEGIRIDVPQKNRLPIVPLASRAAD